MVRSSEQRLPEGLLAALARLQFRQAIKRRPVHSFDMVEIFSQGLVFIQMGGEFLSLLLVVGNVFAQPLDSGLRGGQVFLRLGKGSPLARSVLCFRLLFEVFQPRAKRLRIRIEGKIGGCVTPSEIMPLFAQRRGTLLEVGDCWIVFRADNWRDCARTGTPICWKE